MPTVIRGSDNIDTGNVATQTELNAKVQTAIVTVNGGANIVSATRYVETNPFGNANYEKCFVRGEIFIDGKWSETGFMFSGTGFGTHAYSNAEGIVVQSSGSSFYRNSLYTGDGFGVAGDNTLSSVPCRVIVVYVESV